MPPKLIHDRRFLLYLTYRILVTLAIQMQSVAVGWHIYEKTQSALHLGYVGLAIFLPSLLVALPAGRFADLYPRKTIILISISMVLLCALSLLASMEWTGGGLLHLYATFVLLGLARSLGNPSSSSYLPQLIRDERLSQAIALSSTTFQLGTIIGPALAGLLFSWSGGKLIWVYASSSLLLSLGLIAIACLPRFAPPEQIDGKRLDLFGGIRYVWTQKLLLGAVSLDLFAVLLGGAVALLPIYARDILHVGPEGLGYMRASPAVGAALMAILLALKPMRSAVGLKLFIAVAVFGVLTVVFGLSRSFPLSLACLVFMGAADMISVVIRQTLVQVHTPDSMRGRVAAVNMVFIGASNELGEFESGVTANFWGAENAVLFGGLATVAVVLLWARLFPALRKADNFRL